MDVKDKILQHFQTHYQIMIGHPTSSNGPSLDCVYNIICKKDGSNNRNEMDPIDWSKVIANELELEYNDELGCFIRDIANKFIFSLT